MDELEAKLAELEDRIKHMNASQLTLNKKYLELTELRLVLSESAHFFQQAEQRPEIAMLPNPYEDDLISPDAVETGSRYSTSFALAFVCGTIPRARMASFEKVLWRSLRGNLFLDFTAIEDPIQDPVSEEHVEKNVFIVFAHGKELINKIRKISEAMGATTYPIGPTAKQRSDELREVSARLEDLNNVLNNTSATHRAELLRVGEMIDQWTVFVRKEKAVYHTMNLFNYDMTRKCLIAEGWCPSSAINAIQYALHAVSERAGSVVPPIVNELHTPETPPTYHKTNKFTSPFQTIVDAYGVAKYKEVNPGLFTCITFPFLFAVMFGDVGHGLFVSLIGLFLCLKERDLAQTMTGEIQKVIFGGRYIILLMGFFSIYVGMIYNDAFSLPFAIAPTGWDISHNPNNTRFLGPYPFGIDYSWRMAENSLLFLNSYKMKMSIILGVIHMSFGIFLSVYNSRYFGKKINIYTEFIPQILFMWSIFGYLVFLIIYKWCYPWHIGEPGSRSPPGLLNTLIFMFLKPGDLSEVGQLYPGQGGVQIFLVLLALICIPWMLCIKPYLLWKDHQRTLAEGYRTVNEESPSARSHASDAPRRPSVVSDAGGHGGGGHGEHEKFDFGEIVVHQVIHTIEFCLGAISNTASYLRLWALSLAHSQLSEVLWEMTLHGTLSSPVLLFIGYYMWISLSLGIMVCMEGLSAFLHALRLHWVEFNGKFYQGSGVAFVPFSFKKVLEEAAMNSAMGAGGPTGGAVPGAASA